MLRFLFGKKPDAPVEVKVETQRETFDRLLSELNEALVLLPVKPKVTFDPETGLIDFERPEQFPDEALALPSPDQEPEKTDAADPEPETEKAA